MQVRSGRKSASSLAFTGNTSYKFNRGGPFISSLRPNSYPRIDEDQYFLLQLSGPATLQSVQENAWCSVEGLAERVPVKLISGAERGALLRSQNLDKAASTEPLRFVTLTCNRRFSPAAKVQLVYGKGVSTINSVAGDARQYWSAGIKRPKNIPLDAQIDI